MYEIYRYVYVKCDNKNQGLNWYAKKYPHRSTYNKGIVEHMVRTHTYTHCTSNQTQISFVCNIPAPLDPIYWSRHQLSMNDIHLIASHVPSQYMWLVAMMYDKVCTWSTIQYSFSSPFDVVINGKLIALKHILSSIRYAPTSTVSRIDISSHTHFHHSPPLPKYYVDIETYKFIETMLSPNLSYSTINIVDIPYCFSYKGRRWVATHIDDIHICLTAIYNTSEIPTMYGKGYTHQPIVCMLDGVVQTLSEEVIWLEKDITLLPTVSLPELMLV